MTEAGFADCVSSATLYVQESVSVKLISICTDNCCGLRINANAHENHSQSEE
jgi:hypothetical protein